MIERKRIYMAGCGGMLGDAFYRHFSLGYDVKCTDIDVNERWLSFLDFRDLDAYRSDVREFRPNYLFHLGAYTDLEYCEQNPRETYLTNTTSVENAVYIANELEIPILFISTAGIFDGNKEVYDDWDIPNPMGVYARSKHAGERFVVENANRYLVCRAGWMMGGGPAKDKKFVNKLVQQLKAGARELHVVTDKAGTPTYTHDFAKNTDLLLRSNCWGLYNMVCDGLTSRFEVSAELLRILGLSETVRLIAVKSEHFQKEYFAQRPANERLINRKLELRGLNSMRSWKDALREYVEEAFRPYLQARTQE